MIRSARVADVERLRVIERAAGQRFGEVGMPDIAAAVPMPTETLLADAQAGRSRHRCSVTHPADDASHPNPLHPRRAT